MSQLVNMERSFVLSLQKSVLVTYDGSKLFVVLQSS